jgi:hypothetical protein
MVALRGQALEEPVVRHGQWLCCESFEFAEVSQFAQRTAETMSGRYSSILILPPQSKFARGMPGGSDETIQSLFEKAIQFRTAESHAYYLRTPLGASLHYWNARTRTYEKQVLTGRDIYDMQFGLGRLAWIANYKDRLPELWLVSDRPLNQEEAESLAREVMTALGTDAAMAYIRTDPFAWSKEDGWPFSLPLQWRRPIPESASGLARSTTFCDLSLSGAKALCRAERRQ